MSQIIILCGNMSVGKTTIARQMADGMGYKFISFDDTLMRCKHPEKINTFGLSLDPQEDYIIDNWFGWDGDWKSQPDNTLEHLDSVVSQEIVLMLVGVKQSTIIERHNKRPPNGIDKLKYYQEIQQRQQDIYNKFSSFTSEANVMGWIDKVLSETKIKPKSDIYSDFFSIERCENFHIHFRNLRQVFSESEWEVYCEGVSKAYTKWKSQGKPSPIFQPDQHDPNKKDTKVPPKYLFSGSVNAVHDELPDELAIEKQVDQHYAKDMIHVHYKSLRMDLSSREFLEFADEVTRAAETLRAMRNES